ncbi:MAG: T9SS type A sorting domain-containing protein [Bacteroidota bacterium]|jgi:hypothetical protein
MNQSACYFRILGLVFCLSFLIHFHSRSQSFYKHWDNRFGGNKDDSPNWFAKTSDGGFILAGTSISGISGDKTQPNWDPGLVGSDYWIIRTDSMGVKLWDKRFGGINSEVLSRVIQTKDGGFLLIGNSFSGASGDKSQPNWDPNQQTYDFWIVKLNSNGIKQWDKRFGGNSLELIGGVAQLNDSGYIISGSSFSGVSGDKTQPTQGSWDYWVLRLDSLGTKIWDKRFGGTDDDFSTAVDTCFGGGYLVGGYSQSLAGGDKSQFCQGQWDYWVLKIDNSGNKVWDKTYGGNNTDWLFDLKSTTDGGFILGGQSFSEASGDKSENNNDPTTSSSDRWIVKLDAFGNKSWDRTIGGIETEDLTRVDQTPDGGYFISGESYSPISGDKTENNLGIEQTWVVKTDSLGSVIWDKTVFSNGHDEEGSAILLDSNCFVSLNYTLADTGGYKSQISRGDGDYWIVKLCDYPISTSIEQVVSTSLRIGTFPNPTTGTISIHLVQIDDLEMAYYRVFDLLGTEKMNGNLRINKGSSEKLNLENLSAGHYVLEISTVSSVGYTKINLIR